MRSQTKNLFWAERVFVFLYFGQNVGGKWLLTIFMNYRNVQRTYTFVPCTLKILMMINDVIRFGELLKTSYNWTS